MDESLITEFMQQKVFAVVGASSNPEKYGYTITKNLIDRGYKVYPVNPRLEELHGVKCYKSLASLPEKPDVVDLVVPPKITEEVVKECLKLGLTRVWMQPGAESSAAVEFCEKNGIKVIHDTCVMMH
ncbi:MAG: CoA-binding protein [Candidatus Firestonebacteria bacterium RIFOXYC2_FULL_39_67]|nr:MAG: CoA-binding protein [Candidatus Firestonebacteria bacterium RIFOXYD2_FULL_39_29]OGF55531.1 MAG: CoA-binding protein [Candidatus Firestonebacteria bacterium RIFOXYC2_FULL_39_67]